MPQARYELGPELGRGAQGVVHRAWDRDLRRAVALKRLPRDASAGAQQRFVSEARVPAQLEHPNIIPIYDLGRLESGELFYVMKLVQGQTLGALLEQGCATARALDVLEQACGAMAFAHHRGALHRDLKPSNILVEAFGQVLIVDWGLARAPGAEPEARGPVGQPEGTLGYMALEQALGQVDQEGPWTDVHALGAVLYQVLTGRPARPAVDLDALIPLLNTLPEPPGGPLGTLALRCLSSHRAARPPHAGVLQQLLRLSR